MSNNNDLPLPVCDHTNEKMQSLPLPARGQSVLTNRKAASPSIATDQEPIRGILACVAFLSAAVASSSQPEELK